MRVWYKIQCLNKIYYKQMIINNVQQMITFQTYLSNIHLANELQNKTKAIPYRQCNISIEIQDLQKKKIKTSISNIYPLIEVSNIKQIKGLSMVQILDNLFQTIPNLLYLINAANIIKIVQTIIEFKPYLLRTNLIKISPLLTLSLINKEIPLRNNINQVKQTQNWTNQAIDTFLIDAKLKSLQIYDISATFMGQFSYQHYQKKQVPVYNNKTLKSLFSYLNLNQSKYWQFDQLQLSKISTLYQIFFNQCHFKLQIYFHQKTLKINKINTIPFVRLSDDCLGRNLISSIIVNNNSTFCHLNGKMFHILLTANQQSKSFFRIPNLVQLQHQKQFTTNLPSFQCIIQIMSSIGFKMSQINVIFRFFSLILNLELLQIINYQYQYSNNKRTLNAIKIVQNQFFINIKQLFPNQIQTIKALILGDINSYNIYEQVYSITLIKKQNLAKILWENIIIHFSNSINTKLQASSFSKSKTKKLGLFCLSNVCQHLKENNSQLNMIDGSLNYISYQLIGSKLIQKLISPNNANSVISNQIRTQLELKHHIQQEYVNSMQKLFSAFNSRSIQLQTINIQLNEQMRECSLLNLLLTKTINSTQNNTYYKRVFQQFYLKQQPNQHTRNVYIVHSDLDQLIKQEKSGRSIVQFMTKHIANQLTQVVNDPIEMSVISIDCSQSVEPFYDTQNIRPIKFTASQYQTPRAKLTQQSPFGHNMVQSSAFVSIKKPLQSMVAQQKAFVDPKKPLQSPKNNSIYNSSLSHASKLRSTRNRQKIKIHLKIFVEKYLYSKELIQIHRKSSRQQQKIKQFNHNQVHKLLQQKFHKVFNDMLNKQQSSSNLQLMEFKLIKQDQKVEQTQIQISQKLFQDLTYQRSFHKIYIKKIINMFRRFKFRRNNKLYFQNTYKIKQISKRIYNFLIKMQYKYFKQIKRYVALNSITKSIILRINKRNKKTFQTIKLFDQNIRLKQIKEKENNLKRQNSIQKIFLFVIKRQRTFFQQINQKIKSNIFMTVVTPPVNKNSIKRPFNIELNSFDQTSNNNAQYHNTSVLKNNNNNGKQRGFSRTSNPTLPIIKQPLQENKQSSQQLIKQLPKQQAKDIQSKQVRKVYSSSEKNQLIKQVKDNQTQKLKNIQIQQPKNTWTTQLKSTQNQQLKSAQNQQAKNKSNEQLKNKQTKQVIDMQSSQLHNKQISSIKNGQEIKGQAKTQVKKDSSKKEDQLQVKKEDAPKIVQPDQPQPQNQIKKQTKRQIKKQIPNQSKISNQVPKIIIVQVLAQKCQIREQKQNPQNKIHITQPKIQIKPEPEKQNPKIQVKQTPKIQVKQTPKIQVKQTPKIQVKQTPKIQVKQTTNKNQLKGSVVNSVLSGSLVSYKSENIQYLTKLQLYSLCDNPFFSFDAWAKQVGTKFPQKINKPNQILFRKYSADKSKTIKQKIYQIQQQKALRDKIHSSSFVNYLKQNLNLLQFQKVQSFFVLQTGALQRPLLKCYPQSLGLSYKQMFNCILKISLLKNSSKPMHELLNIIISPILNAYKKELSLASPLFPDQPLITSTYQSNYNILIDEMFLQFTKQLMNNEDPRSMINITLALQVVTRTYHPSIKMIYPFLNYLKVNQMNKPQYFAQIYQNLLNFVQAIQGNKGIILKIYKDCQLVKTQQQCSQYLQLRKQAFFQQQVKFKLSKITIKLFNQQRFQFKVLNQPWRTLKRRLLRQLGFLQHEQNFSLYSSKSVQNYALIQQFRKPIDYLQMFYSPSFPQQSIYLRISHYYPIKFKDINSLRMFYMNMIGQEIRMPWRDDYQNVVALSVGFDQFQEERIANYMYFNKNQNKKQPDLKSIQHKIKLYQDDDTKICQFQYFKLLKQSRFLLSKVYRLKKPIPTYPQITSIIIKPKQLMLYQSLVLKSSISLYRIQSFYFQNNQISIEIIYSDREIRQGYDKKFFGEKKLLLITGVWKAKELFQDILYYTEILHKMDHKQ